MIVFLCLFIAAAVVWIIVGVVDEELKANKPRPRHVYRVYRMDGCMAHIATPVGIAISEGYVNRVVYGSSKSYPYLKTQFKEIRGEWTERYFAPDKAIGLYRGRKSILI